MPTQQVDDFGRPIGTSTTLLSPTVLSPLRTTLTPEMRSIIADALSAQRARAATMPDSVFYGWDAGYASAAELQDLRRQGTCGGGGCNDYFCNWQMWAVLGGIACDLQSFTGVMFQMERYVAAQERLKRLIANMPVTAPKTWWESVAGRVRPTGGAISTTIPDYSGQYAANAARMADWCIEMLRTVAVAQWASNTRWSHPFWSSGGSGELIYLPPNGSLPIDPNDPAMGSRPLTSAEIARGMGGTIGTQQAPGPGGIAISAGGWGVDVDGWNGFARFGYVRGMSPYGVFAPGAWQLNVRQELFPESDMLHDVQLFGRMPYAYLSRNVALRWATDSRGTPKGRYDLYPPRIPVSMSEWDPSPSYGDRMPPWSTYFALPPGTTVREVLTQLFRGTSGTGRANITLAEHMSKRWDLRLVEAGDVNYAMPGPTRQVVLCLQLAYDIIGRNWGPMMSDSFADYVNAVSQMPPTLRTLSPDQMAQVNRAMAQANLDSFASINDTAGGITSAIASVAINPIAGAVVAAVYAILSTLIRTALDTGIFRETSPACLPSPVVRALPEPAEGNACWLVPDQTGQRGGSAAIVERAGAIRDTAGAVDDISEMATVYAATEEAARREIGSRGGGGTTQPTTSSGSQTGTKVAAAAGGVAVGAMLIRLLIGG